MLRMVQGACKRFVVERKRSIATNQPLRSLYARKVYQVLSSFLVQEFHGVK